MKKFWSWFDEWGLFAIGLFLLAFIPLYPKIPLFEAIPGYLVRVRVEDILVLVAGVAWLIQFFRGKINWKTSYHLGVGFYALAGLISFLIAVFLQQTIPLFFVHWSKSLLHYLRYLEYFALLFIFLGGIKKNQQLRWALITLTLTLNLVFLYGWGQRSAFLPAYSTMNREYSKGQALTLSSADKLQATFGGHYDLAAWLVLALPFILAWLIKTDSNKLRIWLGASLLMGGWLMWESGSKTALLAMTVGLGLVIWQWLAKKFGWWKSALSLTATGLVGATVVLSGLYVANQGKFYQLLPFLRPAGYELPVDVIETPLDETWSENARKYGLSMGIRLDTLWPQALLGFTVNPYTGKGYATLNKSANTVFTESDSTDNNFLRVLGETGLLGTLTFFGFLALVILNLIKSDPKTIEEQVLHTGFLAATAGLLLNSVIIDVFAASKVAFTYWGLAGLTLGSLAIASPRKFLAQQEKFINEIWQWLKKSWPVILGGIWLILLVHKVPFSEFSLIQSFELSPADAKYVALTECWLGKITNCTPYSVTLNSVYSLYLLPFIAIYSSPAMYFLANLVLFFASAWLAYQLIRKAIRDRILAVSLVVLLTSLPIIHQLPAKSIPTNLWIFIALMIANKYLSLSSFKLPKTIKKGVLAGVLILIAIQTTRLNLGQTILFNFRDLYRPTSFMTIRRANSYLPSVKERILLAEIEPVLFDLYGNNQYATEKISASSLEQIRQLETEEKTEVYITNSNLDKFPQLQDLFETYKHQLGIRLREIDCRHECNFYQLSTQPVVIAKQPLSWNKVKLASDASRILITDHGFMRHFVAGKTAQILQVRKNFGQINPDLIMSVGDPKDHTEGDVGSDFLDALEGLTPIPVVPVLDSFSDKANTGDSRRNQYFQIDQTWIATLDSAVHHASTPQNVFVYDLLLQLEKQPQVKQVVFTAHTAKWLEYHPENAYFMEDFARELQKHPAVDFYLVINEPIYPQRAEAIMAQLPDNAYLVYHQRYEGEYEDQIYSDTNAFVFDLVGENLQIEKINYDGNIE